MVASETRQVQTPKPFYHTHKAQGHWMVSLVSSRRLIIGQTISTTEYVHMTDCQERRDDREVSKYKAKTSTYDRSCTEPTPDVRRNPLFMSSHHEDIRSKSSPNDGGKVEAEKDRLHYQELKKSHRTSAAKFWRAMLTPKWSSLEDSQHQLKFSGSLKSPHSGYQPIPKRKLL
ncbi:hypothetical protein FPOAC2_04880 [Fusarium poae]